MSCLSCIKTIVEYFYPSVREELKDVSFVERVNFKCSTVYAYISISKHDIARFGRNVSQVCNIDRCDRVSMN